MTITSTSGETSPYVVAVYWGNRTNELTGTVNGQEQNSYLLTISGTSRALNITGSSKGFPITMTITIISVCVIAIICGVSFFTFLRRKGKQNLSSHEIKKPKPTASGQSTSVADQLPNKSPSELTPEAIEKIEQLKQMLDKDLITQQDYDEQKRKLMDKS